MSLPPVLVLDLDGTLVDTADDLIATLNVILETQNMAPASFETAIAGVGRGARVLLQSAFAAAGETLAPPRLDALTAVFLDHYGRHIADRSKPFAGAEAALDRFAAAGWRLAVCTNKHEAPAVKLLSALGMAGRFAAITGQDTFPFCKPDPRHLTETIRLAGGSAGRAVMVGDSTTDIETARRAGVPMIVVAFGYGPLPAGNAGATRVIGHFDELWDAVATLDLRSP